MLPQSAIKRIIPILRKDARRALRMHVPGFPNPYFCSFLLRDIEWFNTWASAGSIFRRRSDRTRNVYCDLRVGSYRYDQTSEGGTTDNDEERESANNVTVPIDDRVYDGLRLALWRLCETKFRESLSDYNTKEAERISTRSPHESLASFVRVRPTRSIAVGHPETVNEERWVKFCRQASRWMSELTSVSTGWVEFDASQETHIFVSTEGSTVVQHQQIFSLTATLRRLSKEGSKVEQDLVINASSQSELPTLKKFKQLVLKKHEQFLKLLRAKNIHSFSGPVLLAPGPSGLLFHEAIGHRLEGSRLLATGEGQTFKGQVGKRILDMDLTIRDNPRLKSFNGSRCIGAYDFDDEGVPSKNTLLVDNGILRDFLTTRAEVPIQQDKKKRFVPNGHARSKKFQRPISRMGVTIVEAKRGLSFEDLKKLLVNEVRKQEKPFGMIVYETSGGETDTTNYDFQAFSGEISYAILVYPDGREECVRGVNFVGTPLQALSNIIAVGRDQEADNSFCGAESGMVPVTTIAPSVLLSNLELQAKDEELVTDYILPKPKLARKKKRK